MKLTTAIKRGRDGNREHAYCCDVTIHLVACQPKARYSAVTIASDTRASRGIEDRSMGTFGNAAMQGPFCGAARSEAFYDLCRDYAR